MDRYDSLCKHKKIKLNNIDLQSLSGYYLRSVSDTGQRGVAQPGSAPALGAGCREFESLHPDQHCARSSFG